MSLSGKLLYRFYHAPKSRRSLVESFGGKKNYAAIQHGEAEMRNYAFSRLAFDTTVQPGARYQLNYLTGEKYIHQSLFCAFSFYKNLPEKSYSRYSVNFYDDGSLLPATLALLNAKFPSVSIIPEQKGAEKLNRLLPGSRYPLLHKKRLEYPHIRKLTDIHLGSDGWQLVLDSDMLFFDRPRQLLEWIERPVQPLTLFDPVSSYHYSQGLMEALSGDKIYPHINVGIAGLKSEDIDWERLEYWIGALEKAEGSSYLLEQALTAMICAGKQINVADGDRYIVNPGQHEVEHPAAILHHYVAGSKEWYYKTAWKHISNDTR